MKLSKKEKYFLIKFFSIFGVLEVIIHAAPIGFLQEFIASTQAEFFGLVNNGTQIFVTGGLFEIVPSCTGLVSASVLAAIIFSLKKPEIKEKITIFAAGLISLLVLNYFRVLLVVWSGKEFGLGLAELIHIISWFSTAALIIALWYYFTKKTTGEKSFSGFF